MNDAPIKDLISLSQAYKIVEELTETTIDQRTCYNWAHKGLEGDGGKKIKLKIVTRLGRYATTRAWIEEFLEIVAQHREIR